MLVKQAIKKNADRNAKRSAFRFRFSVVSPVHIIPPGVLWFIPQRGRASAIPNRHIDEDWMKWLGRRQRCCCNKVVSLFSSFVTLWLTFLHTHHGTYGHDRDHHRPVAGYSFQVMLGG